MRYILCCSSFGANSEKFFTKVVFLYFTNKITEKIKVIRMNKSIITNQFLKKTACNRLLFKDKNPRLSELNSNFKFRRFGQIFKINYIVLTVNFRAIYKKKVTF